MSQARVEPNEIGWMFVPQYYTFLNKEPSKLHCFYTKRSTLIHGTEGEECPPKYGQQEIHDRIVALGFQDCRVYVSNVDSQSSAEGGIIVQVLGEISNTNQPWRKFAQTFFLAEQQNGYFVLNDIFRYLKEDEHDDEESGQSATSSSLPASSHIPDYSSVSNGIDVQSSRSETFGIPASSPQLPSVPAVPKSPEVARIPDPPAQVKVPIPPPEKVQDPPKVNGFHAEESQPETTAPVEEPKAAAVKAEPVADPEEPKSAAKEEEKSLPAVQEPASPALAKETPKAVPNLSAAPIVEPASQPTPSTSGSTAPSVTSESTSAPTNPPSVSTAPTASPIAGPSSSSSGSAPASAPAVAPKPAAPAVKTWANLAAASSKKPAPTASSSSTSGARASASSTGPPKATVVSPTAQLSSSITTSMISQINIPNCFVKGVTFQTDADELKKVLQSKFGPIGAIDVVKDKACAFLEFNTVESARKAVAYCLPVSSGGHGEVLLPKCGSSLVIEPKRKGGPVGGSSDRPTPQREYGRGGKVALGQQRNPSASTTSAAANVVESSRPEKEEAAPAPSVATPGAAQHKKKASKSKKPTGAKA